MKSKGVVNDIAPILEKLVGILFKREEEEKKRTGSSTVAKEEFLQNLAALSVLRGNETDNSFTLHDFSYVRELVVGTETESWHGMANDIAFTGILRVDLSGTRFLSVLGG